ncbi:MAG: D-ribose pyranase [Anaerolineaceae bacterium]|nr:D-ribose pyranase [Anaerolineaceae bacterium]
MIRSGILNPALNSLLARVRHTNMLVIADRGFPYWPMIETVDLSLVDDVPTVLQVLNAIRQNFDICQIYMAEEFKAGNTAALQERFAQSTAGLPLQFEPHGTLKQRVPHAIGLVRTGDTTQYANMVLVSGLPV